jgi:V8-like Glu-specific endopeptidase
MPWMVSLGTYTDPGVWGHQCGASLITPLHVLTAAHCFDYLVDELDGSYKMRMGSSDMVDPEVGKIERNVAKVLVHPKYQQRRAYFDVGLAVADRFIEFTEYVRPICLPMSPVDDEDYLADDFVTLAGWELQITTRGSEPTKRVKLHTLQVIQLDCLAELENFD